MRPSTKKGDLCMSKFCPFMSEDISLLKGKNAPCVESCALYWKGHCSINVLAQTQYKEYMEKHSVTEKVPAE